MVTSTSIKKHSGFSLENAFFYLSLLLLAFAIGAFFYVGYLLNQKNGELAQVTDQAMKTKTDDQKKMETRILSAQQELNDFSNIIDQKKASAEFFNKLETLVLPEIYFSDCKVDLGQMTADLSGHAKSFQALGQQISLFENSAAVIGRVNLGKVTVNEKGGVDFDVKIGIEAGMIASK